ncbi:MAG TPA: PTS IIA-like nitrogen regulatory protein PtsN [Xanthomonadales bacterium]|nr:PTS IIA-like nitrogen regulatory protein PtsN [Xanthomonadales bacterium]
MQLLDLLTPARVVANAHASGKKRLLEQLAQLLDERGTPDSERAIFEALCKRERLGSTGLGRGVAIPHGRSSAIEHPVGAFVKLSEPIDFDAIDGQRVDLVFALVVPEHFTDQHLMFLAQLAELFSDAALVARLRQGRTGAALYETLSGLTEHHAAA